MPSKNLRDFDRSESAALSFGVIAAGGTTVIDYDDASQVAVRSNLLLHLDELEKLAGKPLPIIHQYSFSSNSLSFNLGTLGAAIPSGKQPQQTNSTSKGTSASETNSHSAQNNGKTNNSANVKTPSKSNKADSATKGPGTGTNAPSKTAPNSEVATNSLLTVTDMNGA